VNPLRLLVAKRTWLDTMHSLVNLPLGIITFTVTITLLAVSAGTIIIFPVGVFVAWLLFHFARFSGRLIRARIKGTYDIDFGDPHLRPPSTMGWWSRVWYWARSGSTWREIAYLLLLLPVGVLGFSFVTGAWAGGLTLAALPAYNWALPNGGAHLWVADITTTPAVLLVAVIGVVVLLAAPWVARAAASLDLHLGRRLLGPRDDLQARVAQLESTRARAVDAATAERRRIERDLHDGAQARLVALAMDLGMAREKMESEPDEARALVEEAHEEAKRALVELRDLARGIHPAVLSDRGLDAALSALAARSPVPVEVNVELARRPAPAVEAIAYFVVAEALTNVAKHAGATRASVTVMGRGDRIALEVADDGRGGAEASAGTGLAGLADRVASVDGWLHVISPDGGPTTLLAELPCGS
jgi:signal transduction histidine kinase